MYMRRQQFLMFRVYRFQDTKAYSELYDFYATRVRRYIFFKVPRPEDADELTADVFLRGWEYATANKVDQASSFFYRIARNAIADFYRKHHDLVELDEAKEVPHAAGQTVAEEVADKEETSQVLDAMKQLKEEYREVLMMRFLDEMSIKEIALALDKTSINVRVLLHRAKKALKDLCPEISLPN
jgi:RNA polymerase sigma-70 factor, ECF subfamily